jgi:hypothetical protein
MPLVNVVFCQVEVSAVANNSSRGVLPSVVSECDLENSTVRRPRPEWGCCATKKNYSTVALGGFAATCPSNLFILDYPEDGRN